MKEKKLFLLDAMALIFRAYYAMIRSPRITSHGLNTSAILGFTNTLYEVLKKEKPTHIAVSFDTGAPTVRHADFEEYKAHREATPDDIVNAIPYIKKILDAFNIPVIVMDGYEADDIIGTAAKRAEIEGFRVYMMTSDKDYGQLVSDHIFMYKPGKFGQKPEVIGVKEICEKYSIERPEQLIDILGLWGDASDNIPGVPNIGEVRAKKLIGQFDTIENLYQHIHEVENEKLRQTLIDHKEEALLSKMLATIILDVPVELDFKKMEYKGPDTKKMKEVFDELEFKALTRRILTDLSVDEDKKGKVIQVDLFSEPAEMVTDEAEEEKFDCFDQTDHHFVEIFSADDLITNNYVVSAQTIYFDWIHIKDKIAGFVFSTGDSHIYYHYMEEEQKQYRSLLELLFGHERLVVTYQCKQTYKCLDSFQIEPKCTFFDLQIAHYLIQPEHSHQLERLSEGYLNYALILPDKREANQTLLLNMNCEKIEVYRKLYPIFQSELEKDHLVGLFRDLEMPLAQVLADMEYTGIKVDGQVLQESAEFLNKDLRELEEEIFRLAGVSFNLASPKQLGEVLFEKLRIIENAKLTKTKQYQTGEEILVKLTNKHPIVPLILEWRTLSKLKTTYIDALPQLINPQTGRIHTTFNQTVTSTGRLSSVNPNLQNIPIRTERGRDIRKAFVASDDGSVILSADYSQVELRIVAAVCGDEKMIASFRSGQDIHTAMAAQIYKVPLQEVTPMMRRNAKTVNFGILYGMSAFGLADRLHIPQKEARELIDKYFETFPKINHFLDSTIEFAQKNGYVETLMGRRRYIRDINSHNVMLRKAAERNAINAPIQGTAADLIKLAMVNIYQAFGQQGLRSKMVLQVHDELVFEVHREELNQVKEIVERLMTHAMEFIVPIAVEMGYGKSWYDAH